MKQLFIFLLLLGLLQNGLSLAINNAGGIRMTADSKQLIIPDGQARQMGQLLGSGNFSLTLQFVQAAGHTGTLVSIYSGSSLMIGHLISNAQTHRLTMRLKTQDGHIRSVDAEHVHDLSDGNWHRVVLQVQDNDLLVLVDCDVVIHERIHDIDFQQLLRRQPNFYLGSTASKTDERLIGTLRQFSVDRATFVQKYCPYVQIRPLPKKMPAADVPTDPKPGATVFEHQEPHSDGVSFTRTESAKSDDKLNKKQPKLPEFQHDSPVVPDPTGVDDNTVDSNANNEVISSEVRYLKTKVHSLAEQFSQWKEVVKNYENQLRTVQLHQRGCLVNQLELANGDKWTNNETCTECICILGESICAPLGCAPLDCSDPIHVPGQCCPTCAPELQRCFKDGEWHQHAAVFWPRECVRCECNDGHVTCEFHDVNNCPALSCPRNHQSTPPDECCPKCADIDFCAGNPCGGNATCVNEKWQHACKCGPGFVGNGEHCFDLDECVWNAQTGQRIAKCGKEAHCVNTFGSYECVCKPGYTKMQDGSCLDTIVNVKV